MEGIIRDSLKEEYKNCPIFVFDSVDSTNNIAKQIARKGAAHGTAVTAKSQVAGRGRMNRFFYSPPGGGMYLSLILKRRFGPEDSLFLTIAAAVATCRAIQKLTGKEPAIKWVNDLFLDEKKICGILAEGVPGEEGRAMGSIVVGIGVNVQLDEDALPEELRSIVGALNAEVEPGRLAAEIINQMLDMEKDLHNPEILQEYKEKSLILGKDITYLEHGEEKKGRGVDINEQGNLIVETPEGGREILQSGEVSIIMKKRDREEKGEGK